MRIPLSPYRHFERSEKSSLHTGQRESVRGGAPTRFYLSLIRTEYRQGVKDPSATLGMTIREDGHLTFPFIPSRRRLPLRGSLSSAFGAPLLQGAAQLSCKSAAPKRHFLPDGKGSEMRIPLPHPSLPLEGKAAKREYRFPPHIVISSKARNLPCTPVKRRA